MVRKANSKLTGANQAGPTLPSTASSSASRWRLTPEGKREGGAPAPEGTCAFERGMGYWVGGGLGALRRAGAAGTLLNGQPQAGRCGMLVALHSAAACGMRGRQHSRPWAPPMSSSLTGEQSACTSCSSGRVPSSTTAGSGSRAAGVRGRTGGRLRVSAGRAAPHQLRARPAIMPCANAIQFPTSRFALWTHHRPTSPATLPAPHLRPQS